MKLQTNIGEKIRTLKEEGKTVKEITILLSCSKQIVYYHTSTSYKEKVKLLLKRHRNKDEVLYKKRLRQKYENFFSSDRKGFKKFEFSFEDFLTKLLSNSKCYLTNRELDLSDTSSFSPDHIIPISKGGSCKIDNLGFVCREANMAKSNLSLDEFIKLCKEVSSNFKES